MFSLKIKFALLSHQLVKPVAEILGTNNVWIKGGARSSVLDLYINTVFIQGVQK